MMGGDKAVLYWRGMVANISDGAVDVVGYNNSAKTRTDGTPAGDGGFLETVSRHYHKPIRRTYLRELAGDLDAEKYVEDFLNKIGVDKGIVATFACLPLSAQTIICSYFMGDMPATTLHEFRKTHQIIYEIIMGWYSTKLWGEKKNSKEFIHVRQRMSENILCIDAAVNTYIMNLEEAERPGNCTGKSMYKSGVESHFTDVNFLRSSKTWKDRMTKAWFS